MQGASPSIDDLITRGIPGFIFTGSFLAGAFPEGVSSIPLESNAFLVAILAVSYTVGTFLDLHKHDVFPAPPYFRRLLYQDSNENIEYLGGTAKIGWKIRKSKWVKKYNSIPILPDFAQDLDYGKSSRFSNNGVSIIQTMQKEEFIDPNPENVRELWLEIEGKVGPELNREGRNKRTVYHFLLNLFLSIIVTTLVLIYQTLVSNTEGYVLFIVLLLSMILIILIQMNLFWKYGTRYAKHVVNTYYNLVKG